MWKLEGNHLTSWVMIRLAVADDCSIWSLAVPTHILGSVGLEFWNGASGSMYRWEDPESTMRVCDLGREVGVVVVGVVILLSIVA